MDNMQLSYNHHMDNLMKYQKMGPAGIFNPFKKIREVKDMSKRFEKTKELRENILLLRSVNAKDTPSLESLHWSPKIVDQNASLVDETDKLFVVGEYEEKQLKQFTDDFSPDVFENQLYKEDRWKNWHNERTQQKHERYRLLASYKVRQSHFPNPMKYLRKMANYFYTGPIRFEN